VIDEESRGWGIDCQVRTKLQIPGGMPGGEMVTGRIEPCITTNKIALKVAWIAQVELRWGQCKFQFYLPSMNLRKVQKNL